MKLWQCALLFSLASSASAIHADAQTLARKNWAGSGMSAQVWWQRAVFCRVAPGVTLRQAQAQVDRMQAMGCDAVEFGPVASTSAGANAAPLDPGAGTLEDADALIEEVGRHKLRLVLDLPLAGASEQEMTAHMRFWLTRGVAGLVLAGAPSDPTMIKRLRQVASSVVGTRVLIGDGPVPDTQLLIRRLGGDIAAIRSELTSTGGTTLLAGSVAGPQVSAAVLLGSGMAAQLPVEAGHAGLKPKRDFSPDELLLWVPLGDPSLIKTEEASFAAITAWDAKLTELHHGNEALRTGQPIYLNHDQQGVLAWLVKARPGVPPVLIVCNLSGKPLTISLVAEVKSLGVRGGYLRTLFRADPSTKFATLDAVDLGPDGVLVGEIH